MKYFKTKSFTDGFKLYCEHNSINIIDYGLYQKGLEDNNKINLDMCEINYIKDDNQKIIIDSIKSHLITKPTKSESLDISNKMVSNYRPRSNPIVRGTDLFLSRKVIKGLVSIFMPMFNIMKHLSMTLTAINSVINQTYINWEFIIIDDCSTDKTYKSIKTYIDTLNKGKGNNRIKLIRNKFNSGCYVSVNEGLVLASGEFFARIDADDLYTNDKIEKQVREIRKNSNLVIATCLVQEIASKRIKKNNGTSALYKMSLVDNIGYFDSIIIGADTEYLARIVKVYGRNKISNVDEILYLINKTENSLTTSKNTGLRRGDEGLNKRQILKSNFKKWHSSGNRLFIPYPLKIRPYPVPTSIMSKASL